MQYDYDAIVVGTGPNGFGAAITLAQAGLSVCMYEAQSSVGGGMRTYELTEAGFKHDICSAIHPLAMSSPFFKQLPLGEHGLRWTRPQYPLAHPFDDGTAAVLDRSLDATADMLGKDGPAYARMMRYYVDNWEKIQDFILGPIRIPKAPIAAGLFGAQAALPAALLARLWFESEKTRGFFGGLAAHSFLKMEQIISSSFGLVLGAVGHKVGWPIPMGGSQSIADALASYFKSLGGQIVLDHHVHSLDDLPPARAYLLDVTPKQLMHMAESRLPVSYQTRLAKFRYGPGVFKVDWALSESIPWQADACKGAGTVHIGGTMREIAASERATWAGKHIEQPFVLLAQQSLFDETRAPAGKEVGWAYCHVPSGSTQDMTEIIENQVERFAPGFKDTIIARHTMTTEAFQHYNANYIGGDINGGVQDIFQLFTRPIPKLRPYTTPAKGVYLCSSSTPPGGGVHGMCGYHAAKAALHDMAL